MPQDWEVLTEPPHSFFSREEARAGQGERLHKGIDAQDGAYSHMS